MRLMMKNRIRRFSRIMPALLLALGLLQAGTLVYAADWTVSYTSDSTGYQVVFEDRQELFTESGKTDIIEEANRSRIMPT